MQKGSSAFSWCLIVIDMVYVLPFSLLYYFQFWKEKDNQLSNMRITQKLYSVNGVFIMWLPMVHAISLIFIILCWRVLLEAILAAFRELALLVWPEQGYVETLS